MLANLIFEGIDRVGKSTIIEALHGYRKIKLRAPKTLSETFVEYFKYFRLLMDYRSQEQPIVFDRGHFSERVYGTLYRQHIHDSSYVHKWLKRMEANLVAVIDREPMVRPVVVVYIKPVNPKLMLKDERPNANKIWELAMYERVIATTQLPVIGITTQTDTAWKPVDQIIFQLKERLNV